MKGLLSLDIDGTLTGEVHKIPLRVVEALRGYASSGWLVCLNTGRCFSHAKAILEHFSFPLVVALQNGAQVIHWPSRKLIEKKCIPTSLIVDVDEICEGMASDVVLYSDFFPEEICYYRPHCFHPPLLEQILARVLAFSERWEAVESFTALPVNTFVAAKCFGEYASAQGMQRKIEKKFDVHAPLIRDPHISDSYVVQVTHPLATKGEVVRSLCTRFDIDVVIAAGDDENDLPMLRAAHFAIAMETAPEEVLQSAHIRASCAESEGIIDALECAIGQCNT